MWTIKAQYLLFVCLLFIPLSWAEDMKKNTSKKENAADWSHGKQRRLFARRRIPIDQGAQTQTKEPVVDFRKQPTHPKPVSIGGTEVDIVEVLKVESVLPVRRCSRLMESCFAHLTCCDPCSSCRCRLFNTVCHCWKMSLHCIHKH